PPAQESAMRRALAALQAQQRELGRRVRVEVPTLWTQYELLQIFDRLSLYLCMPPLKAGEVGPAPVGIGDDLVALTVRPAGEAEVMVEPWPFREAAVAASVPGRLVADREYAGDEDLRRELAAAETVTLTYTLRSEKAVEH